MTSGEVMKIITIRQPWAHLIVSGSKNIENRTWPTSYRGPVLIHASLNPNRALCLQRRIDPDTLRRGGVIGIAEISDCVTMHRSLWFNGPYGFVLRRRRPLPFIEWKGALGFRDAPSKLLKRISPRVLREYKSNLSLASKTIWCTRHPLSRTFFEVIRLQ